MISAWLKHLKHNDDKEEFKQYLLGSPRIFDRTVALIEEEEENLSRLEISVKAFESPSWAYMQAYYNGFRACLRMFKKLFTLDQKD